MKIYLNILFAAAGLLICDLSRAQDTLPNFSATTRGNKRVIISWTNNYPVVSQISIQRSSDSTRNFKTILTVPDPTVPQNGFVDSKAPADNLFYRLFIVLENGKYLFSPSKKPTWDTARESVQTPPPPPVNEKVSNTPPPPVIEKKAPPPVEPEKYYSIIRRDSILRVIPEKQYRRFRDSMMNKTRDTILFKAPDTVFIKPFVPKVVYRPSKYVYTERDGNVAISLPEAGFRKYLIKFFDDDMDFIFEVKRIKDNYLIVDKANFLHSGWFRFELYEDNKLKEKHRFFIPKEF